MNTTAFRRRDDDQVVSFLDDDGLNEFLRYFVLAGEGDPIGVCVVVALCIGFCCFCGACVFCEVRTGAWRATARALCRLRAWLRGRNDGPAVKAVSRGVDGGAKSDEKHDDDAGGGSGLVQQTVQLASITHGLQLAPITLGADDDDKGDGGGGRRGYGGAAAAAPAPAALAPTHRAKHAYQPSPVAAWQLPCTQGTLLVLRKNDGDWSEVVLAHFPTIGGAVPTSYLEPVSPDDGGGGSGDDDAPAAAAATATTPPSTADDNPNTNPQDGGGGGGGAVAAAPPDDGFPPLTAGEYDRYMALFHEHDTDADGFVDGATAAPLFKKVRVASRLLFCLCATAVRNLPPLTRARTGASSSVGPRARRAALHLDARRHRPR